MNPTTPRLLAIMACLIVLNDLEKTSKAFLESVCADAGLLNTGSSFQMAARRWQTNKNVASFFMERGDVLFFVYVLVIIAPVRCGGVVAESRN